METVVKEKNREPNLIVFAKQDYTPMQKDIFTIAVSQLDTGVNVQPDLFENKTVTITAKMLGAVTEKNYQRLKGECKEMVKKHIEVSNDAKLEFEFIVPFPRIKYRKGIIELTMFSDVIQSFMELKNGYAEFYVRESLSLEHFNKKRLYEMLSSYKKRNVPVWKVYDDELKFYLGMEVTEYKGRPKEFGTKIVSVCINAINEKTSISVEYTRDKDLQGWHTTFEVVDKKRIEPKEPVHYNEKEQRLLEKLKGLGIVRPDLIRIIMSEHQSACWKWLTKHQSDLAAKKWPSPSGVLLTHLGMVQKKKKTT